MARFVWPRWRARGAVFARPLGWSDSGPWLEVLGGIALASAIAAIYLPVREFGFLIMDDPMYVSKNPNLRPGLTWDSVRWALSTEYFGWFHPITWLSHLLDVSLFDFAPGGHHLTSLCLHVLNALLAVVMLRGLQLPPGRSLAIVALVMLHPTRVESVVWISERKDVLSMSFFFLTVIFWERYRERKSVGWYRAALGAFGLGLGSKAMLVTTPVLLLLIDQWRGRPVDRWRVLRELGPFLVLSGLVSVETIARQRTIGAYSHAVQLSGIDRALMVPVSYVKYLWMTVWPRDLPFWTSLVPPTPRWMGVGALVAMLGLTGLIWVWRRRLHHLAFGWAWFLVSLVPVIGVVKSGGSLVNDRYLYLPHVGLLMGLAMTVPIAGRLGRVLAVAATLALALALGARSAAQVGQWRDSVTLLGSSLELRPNDRWLQAIYGAALQAQGRCPEALGPLGAVAGQDNRARTYLGRCLVILGREREGLAALEDAHRRDSAHKDIAEIYRESLLRAAARAEVEGRSDDAARHRARAATLAR